MKKRYKCIVMLSALFVTVTCIASMDNNDPEKKAFAAAMSPSAAYEHDRNVGDGGGLVDDDADLEAALTASVEDPVRAAIAESLAERRVEKNRNQEEEEKRDNERLRFIFRPRLGLDCLQTLFEMPAVGDDESERIVDVLMNDTMPETTIEGACKFLEENDDDIGGKEKLKKLIDFLRNDIQADIADRAASGATSSFVSSLRIHVGALLLAAEGFNLQSQDEKRHAKAMLKAARKAAEIFESVEERQGILCQMLKRKAEEGLREDREKLKSYEKALDERFSKERNEIEEELKREREEFHLAAAERVEYYRQNVHDPEIKRLEQSHVGERDIFLATLLKVSVGLLDQVVSADWKRATSNLKTAADDNLTFSIAKTVVARSERLRSIGSVGNGDQSVMEDAFFRTSISLLLQTLSSKLRHRLPGTVVHAFSKVPYARKCVRLAGVWSIWGFGKGCVSAFFKRKQ